MVARPRSLGRGSAPPSRSPGAAPTGTWSLAGPRWSEGRGGGPRRWSRRVCSCSRTRSGASPTTNAYTSTTEPRRSSRGASSWTEKSSYREKRDGCSSGSRSHSWSAEGIVWCSGRTPRSPPSPVAASPRSTRRSGRRWTPTSGTRCSRSSTGRTPTWRAGCSRSRPGPGSSCSSFRPGRGCPSTGSRSPWRIRSHTARASAPGGRSPRACGARSGAPSSRRWPVSMPAIPCALPSRSRSCAPRSPDGRRRGWRTR